MSHVTSKWWGGNKMKSVSFHHFCFIYISSMIDDKVMWTSNCHYNVKKWLQVIWYEHKQPYPPTYLPTYLPNHQPTHAPTYLLPICLPTRTCTYLPTYPLTHLFIYLPIYLLCFTTYLPPTYHPITCLLPIS